MNLNKKQWFYFNLVDWLSPAYPAISTERLESLSFAFYSYFRSMLDFDQMREGRESPLHTGVRSTVSLIESSIRELAYLFESNSKFWDNFYHAEKIYFHAIQYEKLEWNELSSIRKADFETLAELKSASLCYPLVDAMQMLNESNSAHEVLLKDLLRHLHLAFQYLEEINNFKWNCTSNQITFARKRVEESMQVQKGLYDFGIIDMQHRFLFSSGVAGELTGYVKEHYEQSLVIARTLHLKDLANFISQEMAYIPDFVND